MKLGYERWWVPDRDTKGTRDIVHEWRQKHDRVLSLVGSRRGTVLQAGGCVGVFPIGLSRFFQTVHTYEPVPELYECLIRNIDSTVKNVYPVQKGFSNGFVRARISKTLENNCGATQVEEGSGILELVTIDSLELEELDLLWLDLEGFEYKALLGAKETIKRCRPVVVIENNGLCHDFPASLDGSDALRKEIQYKFNYSYVDRLMRDDVFIPNLS